MWLRMSASSTLNKTWNHYYHLCSQKKAGVGKKKKKKASTRWRRAEVGTLITFGTKTKSKMKRIVDASAPKTTDEADRDKALCVSSIAANVQYQSVSQSARAYSAHHLPSGCLWL